MSKEEDLRARVAELEAQLEAAEGTVRALASGEVDSVAAEGGPVLLHAAQQRLWANEQLLRAIFDGAMDAMLIADDQGRYVDANPAAIALFGLPKDELLGRTPADFAAVGYEPATTWDAFIAAGRMRGEFPLVRPDGARHSLTFSAVANVLPGLHLSVLRDETQRIAAEGALRESQRLLEEAQALAHVGSWASGATPGEPIVWSAECARIFGRNVDAPPTTDEFFAFVHPSDRAALVANTRDAIALGISLESEHRIVLPNGDARWVYARARIHGLSEWSGATPTSAVSYDARYSVVGIVQDITERRNADETRNRLAAIVEFSNDAILSMTFERTITSWNGGAAALFGYSAEEIVGERVERLLPPERVHEEDEIVDRLARGESLSSYETVRTRKDGTHVDVALTVSPICNAAGEIVAVSKIARDISIQRRAAAALRRADEQLRQAQKMEAIGSLAGGVAHDFNNLLSVILSYTSMILDELPATDVLRDDVNEIHKAGTRATDLTRQLLAFSRKQILVPSVVDLNRVINDVRKMLARVLGEDITLTLLPNAGAGNVHADQGQLEQVLMNLVVNARDAMPTGGALTIETAHVVLDSEYAEAHAGVEPGAYVMMAVTDTGVGMDRATQERVFEPFFTTKDKSKGTGLGLATTYGIVQQSGGHIWLYSEPGKGTTFKIYLPRTDRVAQSDAPAASPATALRGHETVLLVEDDDQLRNIVRAVLRKNGYHVLEAQNGGEAFLVCEQFTARIHLLLTDVVMPRMSGRQLAERISQTRPEMAVLYMSGYTENTIVHHGVLDAGIHFLPKPVTPDVLLRKVRDVLDAAPAAPR